jgi:dihydroxyacetone kinase
MTKLYNHPDHFRSDMLDGFVAAYGRYVKRVTGASGVMAHDAPNPNKVSLVVGGGGGHYPAFCGYVGPGLATAAVMGEVFTSPTVEQIYLVTQAAASPAGVLYCYGNYTGDVLNFDMAAEMCALEGIEVRSVQVWDDVASAPKGQEHKRRGVAGDFFVFKIAGASVARGDTLNTVEAIARQANASTRSFGVAFGGCTLPGRSEPLFMVAPGHMELGLGVHGEKGVQSSEMRPAAEMAKLLVDTILADAPAGAGSRAAVLLNGLGSTKYEEMFVLYNDIQRRLTAAGVDLYTPIVGELVTSLDMAGCSLSLCWLTQELQDLFDAPCQSAAYVKP